MAHVTQPDSSAPAQPVAPRPIGRPRKNKAAAPSAPPQPRETRQTAAGVPEASGSSTVFPSSSQSSISAPHPHSRSRAPGPQPISPAVAALPAVSFIDVAKARDIKLAPDDEKDALLMLCCGALASVGNRALCPKEIAEVCQARGWTCDGSQPFAIISTCIRTHLRRRTTPPTANQAYSVLFSSFDLGAAIITDQTTVGIEKDAKPAVKRGTLWYLNQKTTGYPSPFGADDPTLKAEAKNAKRRSSMPASLTQATRNDSYLLPSGSSGHYEPAEETGSMGRGKRKRKVSSIAGGDASWQSTGSPLMPTSRSLETVSEFQPSHRRAESNDSGLANHGIRRIKLKLSTLDSPNEESEDMMDLDPKREPVLSQPIDTDESADSSSDERDASALPTPRAPVQPAVTQVPTTRPVPGSFQLAMERRRFKKRSRSEGSLLLSSTAQFRPTLFSSASASVSTLGTGADHADRALLSTSSPALHGTSASPEPGSSSFYHAHSASATWAAYRSAKSAGGSVASAADLQRERAEETAGDLDEQDDFHEVMLKGDLDFEFDFAFPHSGGRLPEHIGDTASIDDENSQHSTPATTPRSPEAHDDDPDLYDAAAATAGKSGVGAKPTEIVGAEDSSHGANVTLTGSYKDTTPPPVQNTPGLGMLSPAPPLPTLPLVSAAATMAFAPAVGAEGVEEAVNAASPLSEGEFNRAVFSSRSLSPVSSYSSAFSPRSPLPSQASRAPSPGTFSDADSFDAEIVTGVSHLDDEHLYPTDDDDLSTIEEGVGEESYNVELPIAVCMDEFDLDWGASANSSRCSNSLDAVPFGPEVFGFVAGPIMTWPAPALVQISAVKLEDEDVDMDAGSGQPEEEHGEGQQDQDLSHSLDHEGEPANGIDVPPSRRRRLSPSDEVLHVKAAAPTPPPARSTRSATAKTIGRRASTRSRR